MGIRAGLVRILHHEDDEDKGPITVGAGFVVTRSVIVTCAHVAEAAWEIQGEPIRIQFYNATNLEDAEQIASFDWECWSPPDQQDIAILRLDTSLPDGVEPLPLGSSPQSPGHRFTSFGFPTVGQIEELIVEGDILGRVKDRDGHDILTLDCENIAPGMSGAPVRDEVSGLIVGMIDHFPVWTDRDKQEIAGSSYGRFPGINFATTSETIRKVCKELRISDQPPYLGLATYSENDSALFFGRKDNVNALLDKLRSGVDFISVVGPSGSGKSSVVFAGLFPKLRQGMITGSRDWRLVSFRPGSDPYGALAAEGIIRSDDEGLVEAVSDYSRRNPSDHLILFADQFEEVFALCTEPTKTKFLNEWAELTSRVPSLSLILTLQAGYYYGQALERPQLGKLISNGQETILRMNDEDLRAAIEKPARKLGLSFEKGLVSDIVAEALEVKHPLPLVQESLLQLWDEEKARGSLPMLTHETYNEVVGGVAGAVRMRATRTHTRLSKDDKATAKHIFTRLVHYGEGDEGNTLQKRLLIDLVTQSQNLDSVQRVTKNLADERLLITGDDSNVETQTVEIIHNILIEEWDRLNRWIKPRKAFLIWLQRLNERLHEWQENEANSGLLLRGPLIAEAVGWLTTNEDDLSEKQLEYIRASIAEQKREEFIRKLFRIAAVVVIVVLAISFAISFYQYGKARTESIRAKSLTWANIAFRADGDFNPDLARISALTANEINNPPTQASEALANFGYGEGTVKLFEHEPHTVEDTNWIWDAALNPDGGTAISGGYDSSVIIWDVNEGTREGIFDSHTGIIRTVSFFPDGKTVLSGGCAEEDCAKGELLVWNIDDTGQILHKLEGELGEVLSAAIHPDPYDKKILVGTADGKLIPDPVDKDVLIGTADGELILWNIKTDVWRKIQSEHQGPINSLKFSPDGTKFLSAGCKTFSDGDCAEGLAILWDWERLWPTRLFPQEEQLGKRKERAFFDEFLAAEFFQDGHFIVTGSRDATVRVWDLVSGALVTTLSGHNDWVRDVDIHSNGRWIVSVGCGGKKGDQCIKGDVFIWDFLEQRILFELNGHVDEVQSVSFVPDKEHQILTASRDSTLRIWDISKGVIERLDTGQSSTQSVAFDNQSNVIAGGCSSYDGEGLCTLGKYTLIDRNGNNIDEESLHEKSIVSIALSTDGKRLLTGSADHTATLWNIKEEVLEEITTVQHENEISSVAFTAEYDSSFLTGSYDNEVALWNADSGKQERTYGGMNAAVLALAVSPDGKRIVAGGGSPQNDLIEWDLQSGEIVGRYCGGQAYWDNKQKSCFKKEDEECNSQEILKPEHSMCNEQSEEDQFSEGHTNWITAVAYSPDGQYLLSGGQDGMVILWDTESHNNNHLLSYKDEHADWISSVTFNSESNQTLAASAEGTIFIWEKEEEGQEKWDKIYEFWDPSASLHSVDYLLEQDLVVAGTNTNQVYRYRIDLEEQLTWTRDNRFMRDITDEEIERYSIDEIDE